MEKVKILSKSRDYLKKLSLSTATTIILSTILPTPSSATFYYEKEDISARVNPSERFLDIDIQTVADINVQAVYADENQFPPALHTGENKSTEIMQQHLDARKVVESAEIIIEALKLARGGKLDDPFMKLLVSPSTMGISNNSDVSFKGMLIHSFDNIYWHWLIQQSSYTGCSQLWDRILVTENLGANPDQMVKWRRAMEIVKKQDPIYDHPLFNIDRLTLSNNQLTNFDGTGLNKLGHLILNDNKIKTFNVNSVCSLIQLELANNELTDFPDIVWAKMVKLVLSNNKLTSFNNKHLPELGYLYLSHNQLTSIDTTNLRELRELKLDNNLVTRAQWNTQFNGIITLDLSHNKLETFDVNEFSYLQSLNLSHNELKSFPPANKRQQIRHLFLNDNQLIEFDGINISPLAILDLSNNQLSNVQNALAHQTYKIDNNPLMEISDDEESYTSDDRTEMSDDEDENDTIYSYIPQ